MSQTNNPDGMPEVVDGTPEVVDDGGPLNFDILKVAMPRLWKRTPASEPILALELFGGPYKGVVFAFTKFEVQNYILPNGMAPTRYETEIFAAPDGFVKDAEFDHYTTELLLAWLGHIQQYEYRTIRQVRPRGKVQ